MVLQKTHIVNDEDHSWGRRAMRGRTLLHPRHVPRLLQLISTDSPGRRVCELRASVQRVAFFPWASRRLRIKWLYEIRNSPGASPQSAREHSRAQSAVRLWEICAVSARSMDRGEIRLKYFTAYGTRLRRPRRFVITNLKTLFRTYMAFRCLSVGWAGESESKSATIYST